RIDGDEIVARRLQRGVALCDPFLDRRLRFFEIGEPLLDLRVEVAEAFRLPGDARFRDRGGDVGAEAAGFAVRRLAGGCLWLFLLGRSPVLGDRGAGDETGGDAERKRRAKRSGCPALRQRRSWHCPPSGMGAILGHAACAGLDSLIPRAVSRKTGFHFFAARGAPPAGHWMTRSACSAPAVLIACRIAMMPGGLTPIRFRPPTSALKLDPPTMAIGPPLCSASIRVLGVTTVRPFENGAGCETRGCSLTRTVSVPYVTAT